MKITFFIMCLFGVLSCLSLAPQREPDQNSRSLRKSEPKSVLPQSSNAGAASNLIKITIREVKNDRLTPVTVHVFMNAGNNGKLLRIGDFSLFPANQSGEFLFDLQGSLSDGSQNFQIVLELQDPGQFDDQFFIMIEPWSWEARK